MSHFYRANTKRSWPQSSIYEPNVGKSREFAFQVTRRTRLDVDDIDYLLVPPLTRWTNLKQARHGRDTILRFLSMMNTIDSDGLCTYLPPRPSLRLVLPVPLLMPTLAV